MNLHNAVNFEIRARLIKHCRHTSTMRRSSTAASVTSDVWSSDRDKSAVRACKASPRCCWSRRARTSWCDASVSLDCKIRWHSEVHTMLWAIDLAKKGAAEWGSQYALPGPPAPVATRSGAMSRLSQVSELACRGWVLAVDAQQVVDLQYSVASSKALTSCSSASFEAHLGGRGTTIFSGPLALTCCGRSHFRGFLPSYPGQSTPLPWHFRHFGRAKSHTRRRFRHSQHCLGPRACMAAAIMRGGLCGEVGGREKGVVGEGKVREREKSIITNTTVSGSTVQQDRAVNVSTAEASYLAG